MSCTRTGKGGVNDAERRGRHPNSTSPPRAHGTARSDGARSARPAPRAPLRSRRRSVRSEEHTSELQSLMRISYAVFCLTKKKCTSTKSPAEVYYDTYQATGERNSSVRYE